MEQLPTHIKINILGFIPRRIHPTSVIMKREIDACARHWTEAMRFSPWMRNAFGIRTDEADMWGAWWYESRIMTPYKEKTGRSEDVDYNEDDEYSESEHLIRDENE